MQFGSFSIPDLILLTSLPPIPHPRHWIGREEFGPVSLGFLFLSEIHAQNSTLCIRPLLPSKVASGWREKGFGNIRGRGPQPSTGSGVCTGWTALGLPGPVPHLGVLPACASKACECVVPSFSAVRARAPPSSLASPKQPCLELQTPVALCLVLHPA